MKNDGGPAFPSEQTVWRPDKVFQEGEAIPCRGMSLRDYFAAKALQGMIGHSFLVLCCGGSRAALARECYQFADAMLAERSKP